MGRFGEKKDVVGVSYPKEETGAVKVSVDDQKEIWKEHMGKVMNVENECSNSTDTNKVVGAVRIFSKQGYVFGKYGCKTAASVDG